MQHSAHWFQFRDIGNNEIYLVKTLWSLATISTCCDVYVIILLMIFQHLLHRKQDNNNTNIFSIWISHTCTSNVKFSLNVLNMKTWSIRVALPKMAYRLIENVSKLQIIRNDGALKVLSLSLIVNIQCKRHRYIVEICCSCQGTSTPIDGYRVTAQDERSECNIVFFLFVHSCL